MADTDYTIEISPAAERALARLAVKTQRQIASKIATFAADPHPPGVRTLEATEPALYRVRVGDYRIVYAINDAERKLVIALIGDRKDVYRRGLP